ncbi:MULTISPECIES: acetyl-CoA carboxylase biotin carboxyl carrier protein [Rhodococcus]|jgi:acetyl-CoA carboxylase biotin carboxyl carrier protein|uniref:acetyl-CoA carboxylase biotin carboxyl carrier protein n=1 Tax=Rhodococcus TaxID=1827 RepID=UPI0010641768|nr:biotin/lipoyl-containing protein [Rhodococcus opacus]NHU47052.1 acetyl-CoA carboxylase biotin carboxyl carrier protein subunit [Rhodococcus sp. A14]UZG59706.1 acetyl-CoA carboxylase biotin carboxyl carrier protein subunit [Rhodococcus opacus]
MSLTHQEIREIVLALQDSEWDQAAVTVGDVRIALGRNGVDLLPASAPTTGATAPPVAAAAPAAAPATPPAPVAAAPVVPAAPVAPTAAPTPNAAVVDGHVVTAPSVGVFWKTPQPGQPPFVEIGSEVEAGDTLCIIEVMKLMNNVTADVAGTIVAIHQDNATQVEFGTALFTIAPRDA